MKKNEVQSIRNYFTDLPKTDQVKIFHEVILDLTPLPEAPADGSYECPKCKGLGKCADCDGKGRVAHECGCEYCTQEYEECHSCDNSGSCRECDGQGRIYPETKTILRTPRQGDFK